MNDPRLLRERNIWMATVRPDGRPHLVPIWFVWLNGRFYLCTGKASVKGRNLQVNPTIALALEDGSKALIAEGAVTLLDPPFAPDLAAAFQAKYEWDMRHSDQYNMVVEVIPQRWLQW